MNIRKFNRVVKNAMETISIKEHEYSCSALFINNNYNKSIMNKYAKFFGKNSSNFWDFDQRKFKYDDVWFKYRQSCRLTMLSLFLVTKGKL